MEGITVKDTAAEEITARLSSLENLYFPRAVQTTAASSDQRKSILLDLLRRDPAVFLERYGSELKVDELLEFDDLKHDYEVDWHLKNLRKKISPTSEELKSRSVAVRNRRLAYLNKLVSEGQYFSEDAMRDREPYLHHEYVGKFQDVMGRNMARPGERWSETLMRRAEEATLVTRIREEQQRLGVVESDWVGNEKMEESEEGEEEEEEEEEEESEEDDEVKNPTEASSCLEEVTDGNGALHDREHNDNKATVLPPEEMQDMMDQFTSIMQQKFLSGEDHQHLDYTKIDNDETLDDHWLREIGLDAEEKYFGED
ncbi:PREDICTED: coiled-coil domain-containing protein 97-like [Camelina sativa]|uniref:Coiled-coil domain-containing protein 97-like n=1 Tax=Camelina sativa TaxID=90675 RepID=A0ABM0X683_CAMSA|nr:PREDICTED: coiled-coil domain-containing protein 97-like [Camelina sativa]